jgi:uncharacterized SAM-binding protein YcdF (DUF218 family)
MKPNKSDRPGCVLKTWALALGWIPFGALALIVGAILLEFLLTAMGGFLIVSDPIENKADAVVVLSGGDGRLEEAARLWNEKQVDFIILTETGEVIPDFGKYSEIKRFDAMINLGIPAGVIMVTERSVKNTADEAHVVRKLIQPMNLTSLIVVTDPFHTLRARMIFDDEFRNTDIKVMIHPIPGHWYKSSTWWTSRAGWEATMGEYVRVIYYLAKERK